MTVKETKAIALVREQTNGLVEGVINLTIREGKREIKGLRIYQKESLVVR